LRASQRQYHSTITAPITPPTRGRAQSIYFILLSFHSTRGVGMDENMEKAMAIDLKISFI
jgi:hypothetical protein